MMELQAHHQGNLPGIPLYGSRCNPYTFTTTRIPRPLFLDSLHSRQPNTFTRDRFQAWASSNKPTDDAITMAPHATSTSKTMTEEVTTMLPTPALTPTPTPTKPRKPFVAEAAFPKDIPRLVEIEFAAFQDEIVNHQLSYRDGSNPEHIARTQSFYQHCMQHMRKNALPTEQVPGKALGRFDSKVDLTVPEHTDTDKEGYRFREVLDPQTKEIIAFCKTEITTLTPEDHASPLDIGHENEPQMNRDWFALNEKLHRLYCGDRQHLCKLPLLSFFRIFLLTLTTNLQTSACSLPTPTTNTAAPQHR